jgi:hypothetical protein
MEALERAWRALEQMGLPMALMGGLAVAAWKHVRATRDVDLLVGVASLEPEALLERLAGTGLRPKRVPAVMQLGQLRILPLLCAPLGSNLDVQVDLLLADSPYHRQALDRRIPTTVGSVGLAVLACEDLILHKLLAGRLLDRADAAALLRLNRDDLDFAYLRRWSGKLRFAPALAEVWEEAFPGEALLG